MSVAAEIGANIGALHLEATVQVARGEVVALLGPNGAGKTTLLRVLAGLVPLEQGRVVLDDQIVEDTIESLYTPPERRPIGFVFQDYLLFPHLSVLENVAFGLRASGVARRTARSRAASWLERVGLASHASERPQALSGGQAQKVALARALATDPKVLLLDEPLAALDAVARARVRLDLQEHLRSFEGGALLVTHDPLEAIALADRLIVFEAGRVVQSGSAEDLRLRPRSSYAANLAGVNLFRGVAQGRKIQLEPEGLITTSGDALGAVYAVIHPRSVALYRTRPEGTPRNVWYGDIEGIDSDGHRVRVAVRGRPSMVAEITPEAMTSLALRPGDPVWAAVKASEVSVYPA